MFPQTAEETDDILSAPLDYSAAPTVVRIHNRSPIEILQNQRVKVFIPIDTSHLAGDGIGLQGDQPVRVVLERVRPGRAHGMRLRAMLRRAGVGNTTRWALRQVRILGERGVCRPIAGTVISPGPFGQPGS